MYSYDVIEKIAVTQHQNSDPSSVEVVDDRMYLCFPKVCSIVCYHGHREEPIVTLVKKHIFDLCYDAKNKCFYALAFEDRTVVLILDEELKETGQFTIAQEEPCELFDLAFYQEQIYVLTQHQIMKVDCEHHEKQDIMKELHEQVVNLQMADHLLVLILRDANRDIIQLDDLRQEDSYHLPLDMRGRIMDINFHRDHLYILFRSRDETFQLITCYLEDSWEDCCCHEDRWEAHREECCENYDERDSCCECEDEAYEQQDCKTPCCDRLVQRTAELEEALACILNAEGEKIQSVVEQGCSVKELLQVNASVQCTISQISLLEHILYAKLQCCKQQGCDSPCDCELDQLIKLWLNKKR